MTSTTQALPSCREQNNTTRFKASPRLRISPPLTTAEWFLSWPGTREQKMPSWTRRRRLRDLFIPSSGLRVALRAADFSKVVERMRGWASGRHPAHRSRTHVRNGTASAARSRNECADRTRAANF